jgi:hypothetical protein
MDVLKNPSQGATGSPAASVTCFKAEGFDLSGDRFELEEACCESSEPLFL